MKKIDLFKNIMKKYSGRVVIVKDAQEWEAIAGEDFAESDFVEYEESENINDELKAIITNLNAVKCEYRKLSMFNRLIIIDEIKKQLKEKGAIILTNKYKKLKPIKPYISYNDRNKEKIEAINARVFNCYTYPGGDSLTFIYKTFYFYFSFDDNPFFPVMYQKIKLDNAGNYCGKRYIYSSEDRGALDCSLCYDAIFKIMDDETAKKCASHWLDKINNYLISESESERINEKKRVNNLYNNGYHYEILFDKTKLNIFIDPISKNKYLFEE